MPARGIKNLSVENWLRPDDVSRSFVTFDHKLQRFRHLDGDDWAKDILQHDLTEAVPAEVATLFATARGSLVYGYFFYPLYALGLEQLFRVSEAAVASLCEVRTGEQSHASDQMLLPPGDAVFWFARVTKRINDLFSTEQHHSNSPDQDTRK